MSKKMTFAAGISLCALIVLLTVFYAASGVSAKRVSPCDIADSYAKNKIEAILDAGLMETFTVDDRVYFEPDAVVTRAMLAQALVAYLGIDTGRYRDMEIGFADESATYEAYLPAVRAVLANGLMPLTSDYRFEAERAVSREEAAYLFGALCRAEIAAGKEASFSDFAEVDGYFLGNAKKAVDFDIMIGYTDGTFRPKNDLTREELALILYRLSAATDFRKE